MKRSSNPSGQPGFTPENTSLAANDEQRLLQASLGSNRTPRLPLLAKGLLNPSASFIASVLRAEQGGGGSRRGATQRAIDTRELSKLQSVVDLMEELRPLTINSKIHSDKRLSPTEPDFLFPGGSTQPFGSIHSFSGPGAEAALHVQRAGNDPLNVPFPNSKNSLQFMLQCPISKAFSRFFQHPLYDELMENVRRYVAQLLQYQRAVQAAGVKVGLEQMKRAYVEQLALKRERDRNENGEDENPSSTEEIAKSFGAVEPLAIELAEIKKQLGVAYCRVLQKVGGTMKFAVERKFYTYLYISIGLYIKMLVAPSERQAVRSELEGLFNVNFFPKGRLVDSLNLGLSAENLAVSVLKTKGGTSATSVMQKTKEDDNESCTSSVIPGAAAAFSGDSVEEFDKRVKSGASSAKRQSRRGVSRLQQNVEEIMKLAAARKKQEGSEAAKENDTHESDSPPPKKDLQSMFSLKNTLNQRSRLVRHLQPSRADQKEAAIAFSRVKMDSRTTVADRNQDKSLSFVSPKKNTAGVGIFERLRPVITSPMRSSK